MINSWTNRRGQTFPLRHLRTIALLVGPVKVDIFSIELHPNELAFTTDSQDNVLDSNFRDMREISAGQPRRALPNVPCNKGAK
jgi:hypothetical protein